VDQEHGEPNRQRGKDLFVSQRSKPSVSMPGFESFWTPCLFNNY
jgi:hypothetical protein